MPEGIKGFQPGISGNPNGRPAGALNKTTVYWQELLQLKGEKLLNKAIELANNGNAPVLNKLLDKILPTLNQNDTNITGDLSVNFVNVKQIASATEKPPEIDENTPEINENSAQNDA